MGDPCLGPVRETSTFLATLQIRNFRLAVLLSEQTRGEPHSAGWVPRNKAPVLGDRFWRPGGYPGSGKRYVKGVLNQEGLPCTHRCCSWGTNPARAQLFTHLWVTHSNDTVADAVGKSQLCCHRVNILFVSSLWQVGFCGVVSK